METYHYIFSYSNIIVLLHFFPYTKALSPIKTQTILILSFWIQWANEYSSEYQA